MPRERRFLLSSDTTAGVVVRRLRIIFIARVMKVRNFILLITTLHTPIPTGPISRSLLFPLPLTPTLALAIFARRSASCCRREGEGKILRYAILGMTYIYKLECRKENKRK